MPYPEIHDLHMPVTYPQIYLDLAQERGITAEQVLHKAGLEPALFADPQGRIPLAHHFRLVTAIVELTQDPGIGFELGCRSPVTVHGSLGYALLCCATLEEATKLLQRFWELRAKGLGFSYQLQGEWNVISFYSKLPLSGQLRRLVFDFILTSVYRGIQFLAGPLEAPGEIWFDYPEPDYYSRFKHRLPPIRYNMAELQIRIPGPDLMHQRLPLANPEGLSLAIAQCEREYALLGEGCEDVLTRAKTLLNLSGDGYPSLDDLASQLNLSPRSLRRQLQAQGSSYRRLLEEARRRDAINLLTKPELEIQKIAELLGYTDPANFTRAFRQWTGKSPSQYRKLLTSTS